MDYAAARQTMVDCQIRPNRDTDPLVLEAMEQVPRDRFVPKALQGVAYADETLNLGGGRVVLAPMVLARMLQALNVDVTDSALDVACGLGYSTAVLARLASSVVGVESDSALVDQAVSTLNDLSVDNAAVLAGSVTEGLPSQGPFNVILINGAVQDVPRALLRQLADGGRLVAVVRPPDGRQGEAVLYTRSGDSFGHRPLFDANAPVLPEFVAQPTFTF